jgi:hypothetical protein
MTPEVVWHTLCPKGGTDALGGTINPQMRLARTLDDVAGRQLVYVCPSCGMEVSVNFPPVRDEIAAVIARLQARREGGCEQPPCPEYVPKRPEDHGYSSCRRCGWAEPEHVIDQLLAIVKRLGGPPPPVSPAVAEREREVEEIREAVLAAGLSPNAEARALLADCKSRAGELHEPSLLRAVADVVLQRNTALGVTVLFRRIS